MIKLYQTLVRGSGQIAYYHPGVGTIGAMNALTWAGKAWTKFRGLAFGYGLSENIADAYRYLMREYEEGDRVFVFGFSRGAYTARAVCGMLATVGLLYEDNEGQIPYALRLFKRSDGAILSALRGGPNKFVIAARFKKTFCRDCRPHFAGLFDTVSSVGWILDPIGLKPGRLPHTADLKGVATIRHAVSIDERRAFFRQNLVNPDPPRDLKQVWFAGVHSDVGGSYPEGESGLSKITLGWMLREAVAAGLSIDPSAAADILGAAPQYAKPTADAAMHNSMKGIWPLAEFWPKAYMKRVSPPDVEPVEFKHRVRLNLFQRRFIAKGSTVHASVFERRKLLPKYAPSNLPHEFQVEDGPPSAPSQTHLEPGQQTVIGVHAVVQWNDTHLLLRRGEKYRFDAAGTWYDATIRSGPAGYPSQNLFQRLTVRLRRSPGNDWFTLIGSVGKEKGMLFPIGPGRNYEVTCDGMLYGFANDLSGFYFNNSGWVRLTVTRVA